MVNFDKRKYSRIYFPAHNEKNPYIIKEFFDFTKTSIHEVSLLSSDSTFSKKIQYYASLSSDWSIVVIFMKNKKQYFLLEYLKPEDFTKKYKIIND